MLGLALDGVVCWLGYCWVWVSMKSFEILKEPGCGVGPILSFTLGVCILPFASLCMRKDDDGRWSVSLVVPFAWSNRQMGPKGTMEEVV